MNTPHQRRRMPADREGDEHQGVREAPARDRQRDEGRDDQDLRPRDQDRHKARRIGRRRTRSRSRSTAVGLAAARKHKRLRLQRHDHRPAGKPSAQPPRPRRDAMRRSLKNNLTARLGVASIAHRSPARVGRPIRHGAGRRRLPEQSGPRAAGGHLAAARVPRLRTRHARPEERRGSIRSEVHDRARSPVPGGRERRLVSPHDDRRDRREANRRASSCRVIASGTTRGRPSGRTSRLRRKRKFRADRYQRPARRRPLRVLLAEPEMRDPGHRPAAGQDTPAKPNRPARAGRDGVRRNQPALRVDVAFLRRSSRRQQRQLPARDEHPPARTGQRQPVRRRQAATGSREPPRTARTSHSTPANPDMNSRSNRAAATFAPPEPDLRMDRGNRPACRLDPPRRQHRRSTVAPFAAEKRRPT